MPAKKTAAALFAEARKLEQAYCFHEASVVEEEAKALLKKEKKAAAKKSTK